MRTYLELRPVPPFLDLDPVMALWNSPAEFERFHASDEGNRLDISSPSELEAVIRHHVALAAFLAESDQLGVRGIEVEAAVRAALLVVAPRLQVCLTPIARLVSAWCCGGGGRGVRGRARPAGR